jgi:hypothetical protein
MKYGQEEEEETTGKKKANAAKTIYAVSLDGCSGTR